jgi:hypothetical protein
VTTFLAGTVATFVTVPMLTLITVYIFCLKISHNKKKSFHVAVDVTTFFLILSVHTLIFVIWGKTLIWVIAILLLFTAIGMSLVYWSITEEIRFQKLMKGVWRLNFLIFLTAHLLLTLYGMLHYIIIVV